MIGPKRTDLSTAFGQLCRSDTANSLFRTLLISKNGMWTSAEYPDLPIIYDKKGVPEDPIGFVILARRVLDRAMFDLSSSNKKIRSEAKFFFEDPSSLLWLWCDLAFFPLENILEFYRNTKHLLEDPKTTRAQMYAAILNRSRSIK